MLNLADQGTPTRRAKPANANEWVEVDSDTESTFVHAVNNASPVLVAYCACYVDKKLKSDPKRGAATCTVSP